MPVFDISSFVFTLKEEYFLCNTHINESFDNSSDILSFLDRERYNPPILDRHSH